MKKIKIGDIVGRKSYGKDVIFIVDRIINLGNKNGNRGQSYAILKGLTIRIKADSKLEDLELIDRNTIKISKDLLENKINEHINKYNNNHRNNVRSYKSGKILHLDGDLRYSQKSVRYYKSLGINAIVKNISESRQPLVVRSLLERYKPDILVITRS